MRKSPSAEVDSAESTGRDKTYNNKDKKYRKIKDEEKVEAGIIIM